MEILVQMSDHSSILPLTLQPVLTFKPILTATPQNTIHLYTQSIPLYIYIFPPNIWNQEIHLQKMVGPSVRWLVSYINFFFLHILLFKGL